MMAPRGGRGGQNRKKAKGNKDERRRKRDGHAVLNDIIACAGRTPHPNSKLELASDGKKLRVTTKTLTHLPESIGTLDGLQKLNLSDCSQLSELPDAISGLKALTELNLHGCSSLVELPATIGELGALTELILLSCSSLTALPATIGELRALTTLNLSECSSLAALPTTVGELKALILLDLTACTSLAALPVAIGGLGALTELNLQSCSSLAALPDAISELGALTDLSLEGCSSLAALPATIGELRALTELDLSECSSLVALPTAIGGLKALTELYLTDCLNLVALPDAIGKLGALTTLNLDGCSSLTTLPDVIRAMPGLTICDSNSGLDKTRREKPEAALRCPISTALLVKPLRAKPCGHVYSKASVQGYYKDARKCVVFGCEAMLSSWDFVPDVPTEIALENYKERLQTTDADEAADQALADLRLLNEFEATDRGQPREEQNAEIDRKILEDYEDEGSLSHAQILRLRRLRRRVCDACGRQGTLEVERFPVCYCGAKR